MRRSILSTLLIGSIAAFLFQRYRRSGNFGNFAGMMKGRQMGGMGLFKWMNKARGGIDIARIISMVFGRNLLRRAR
ncbi:hypothetical protein [Salinithrix halophila]|uniref:Uncharacterized protein n=1 Tax=Salinithrix halophila TaxID=1485204 RepID=A0ABV8JE26_9BACL